MSRLLIAGKRSKCSACVQSLILAGPFLKQPIAAKCCGGRNGIVINYVFTKKIYLYKFLSQKEINKLSSLACGKMVNLRLCSKDNDHGKIPKTKYDLQKR